MLLVAIGRKPVTESLGLEALGVELERGYVKVNPHLQTAVPHIYAIGDVINTPWLAHVASAEGILAVEHMAGLPVKPLELRPRPLLHLLRARGGERRPHRGQGQGARLRGGRSASSPSPRSARRASSARPQGFVKVVRETKYDEVLGVHIVGAHATDLIAEACVALQLEGTDEELLRTMHAHPTLSEAVMEAAHAAHGAAIHI